MLKSLSVAAAFGGCALAALLAATPAFAHHPDLAAGGSGGGIITGGAATLDGDHFAIAFLHQYIRIRDFKFNTLGPEQHAHSMRWIQSPSLSASYGLTDDITVSVRLPWVARHHIRDGHVHDDPPAHVELLGNSAGIGDVTVTAQWRFYNNEKSGTALALIAGIKLPTGGTHKRDRFGERFETEFQPGSGSWDPMFGLAASQSFGAWSVHANVLYLLATTGAQRTDLGDRLLYGAAISVRLFGGESGGFGMDAVLEVNGEWQARMRAGGERDPDSGGHTVFLSPGVRVLIDNVAASLSVGIPIVREWNGNQSPPSWRVLAGASMSF